MVYLSLFFLSLSCSQPLEFHKENLEEGIYIYRNVSKTDQRIALVTFISEPNCQHVSEDIAPYAEIVQFGTRSKTLYCQKNGYDYIIATQKLFECDGIPAPNIHKLSIHWMKVCLLAKFLPYYDWVVWSDADSIFLNHEITLESLIDDNFDLLIGTQTAYKNCLNTGHIFVKNTLWSKGFLKEWWCQSEELQEGYWDQEKLIELLRFKPIEYHKHWRTIPLFPSDLSKEEFCPGDMILHFYGFHGKELYELFLEAEEKYSSLLDGYEWVLNNTQPILSID
jgi:hypothetical protein